MTHPPPVTPASVTPALDIYSPRDEPWIGVYKGVRSKEHQCQQSIDGQLTPSALGWSRCLQNLADYRRYVHGQSPAHLLPLRHEVKVGILSRQMTWDSLPTVRTLQPVKNKWQYKGTPRISKSLNNTPDLMPPPITSILAPSPSYVPQPHYDEDTHDAAPNTSVDYSNLRSCLKRQASIPAVQRSSSGRVPVIALTPRSHQKAKPVLVQTNHTQIKDNVRFRLTLSLECD